ncbi:MAG TPA: DUF58 domain-containing protein [Caulobacteraceae bacterium]|nr:DUF58 domain-containing protein [Caulobacteraceae bacterium]
MIYPTVRAIALAMVGAPLALILGVLAPKLWLLGPAWLALVFALVLADALLGADRRRAEISLTAPGAIAAGRSAEGLLQLTFARGATPARVQLALQANARIEATPARQTVRVAERMARARFVLRPNRRGRGQIEALWARWQGPFGLVWKQKVDPIAREVAITLNIQSVKDEAIRLFSRNALYGTRIQFDLGSGSEFHALNAFQPGMDRRTIDWKQSARHSTLLAKEFRAERNHPIILAIDTGRLMCEPLAGLPRVDHALNAALILAYVSLKAGDRAGLFAFDARPHVSTGPLSGPSAFAHIQRLATAIDYSTEEANFTLGLTELAGQLSRRTLVVVFTDFADTTSAELMLDNVARLLAEHLVIFVVMRDDELEDLARQEPVTPEDVSRAVVAQALLRERDLVVARLRRLGVQIVEAPAERIGPALLDRYLDLKRRDLL